MKPFTQQEMLDYCEKVAIDAGAVLARAEFGKHPYEIVVTVRVVPDADGSEIRALHKVGDTIRNAPERYRIRHTDQPARTIRIKVQTDSVMRKHDTREEGLFAARMRKRRRKK